MSETPKPPSPSEETGPSRQPRQIPQRHDALFKHVFSKPSEAAALLSELLPEAISARFAWDTLRRLPTTFVDDQLRRTESDLLFEVDQRGAEPPARICVLIEHQSSTDRFMALRLLRYCVDVLEAARREDRNRKRLPPVLPVVVYQGPRPWPYPTSLDGILEESARELPWGVRLDYLLLDQGAGGMSTVVGALFGRLAQYAMLVFTGPASERKAALAQTLGLMGELWKAGKLRELEVLRSYLYSGKEESAMEMNVEAFLKDLAAMAPDRESKSIPQLVWDHGREEGRSLGHAEGHSLGRAEGIQIGEHRATVATVEGLLRAGVDWSAIQSATGLDRRGFETLREQLGSDGAP